MNEELIKKVIEYMESSKDFILEQAPDVIQQILRYQTINNTIGLVFSGVLVFIGIGTFIWLKYFKNKEESPFRYFFWTPLWLSLVFFGVGLCNIGELIKIKIAPKYYILQKIKENK